MTPAATAITAHHRRGRPTPTTPARRRFPRTLRAVVGRPTITATAVSTAMILVSLTPGLLPRPVLTQAVFSGLLVALGLAAIAVLGPAHRATAHPTFLLAATALVAVATLSAAHWQNGLRTAMGQPPVGWTHWILVALGAAGVVGTLTLTGRAVRATVRFLRRRHVGPPTLLVLAVLATSMHLTTVTPAAADPLGTEGRRFVSAATGSPRVYIGLDAATDPTARAHLAVDELDRTGALAQPNLVIAVPTGSGWIDENAATGLEHRFHGRIAIVGAQYSAAPSWVGFLFDRTAATESARALFDAVSARLAQLPPDQRPNLYVYGQSLGALAGASVFSDGPDQDARTCAVLWAGPPAGDVPRQGATVLANRSDPVVRWSPRLLLHPPELADTRPDAPTPPWLPIVGFLQTTVDLLGALDAPAGHGHRYGLDQGTAMGTCSR